MGRNVLLPIVCQITRHLWSQITTPPNVFHKTLWEEREGMVKTDSTPLPTTPPQKEYFAPPPKKKNAHFKWLRKLCMQINKPLPFQFYMCDPSSLLQSQNWHETCCSNIKISMPYDSYILLASGFSASGGPKKYFDNPNTWNRGGEALDAPRVQAPWHLTRKRLWNGPGLFDFEIC